MATLQVTGWKKEYIGFTGWDAHAKSEFKKRLRRSISTSPHQRRDLASAVHARQPVIFHGVHDDSVESLRQILETMGAEVTVSMANSQSKFTDRWLMSKRVIFCSPDIMGGTPCFSGTRVPVQTLLDYLEAGESINDFLEGFPTVSRQQVLAFLERATSLAVAESA